MDENMYKAMGRGDKWNSNVKEVKSRKAINVELSEGKEKQRAENEDKGRCGEPERKAQRIKIIREEVGVEGLNEDEKEKLKQERWQENEAEVND